MQVRSLPVLATAALLTLALFTAACGSSDATGDASATEVTVTETAAVDVSLPAEAASPVAADVPVEQQISDFAGANGMTDLQTTASGLAYVILEPGGPEHPSVSDQITIHYHGYLVDGKTFDRTKGTPRTFPLSGLIPAWQEAIPLIGRGGVIRILAPPSTAYGQRPPPGSGITPSSVLVFDIALSDFGG